MSNMVRKGGWITLGDSSIAELFCRSGVDFVVIDLEHSFTSIESAGEMIRVCDLLNVVSFARIPLHDKSNITRLLDAGCSGIISPMINTVQDAQILVDLCLYPPRGSRGVGLARAQRYGDAFDEYLHQRSKKTEIVVQIEHIDAVNNFEDISLVLGISGCFIGPYDLSCSLGEPGNFESSQFKEALEHVVHTAKKRGLTLGIHAVEPDINLVQQYTKDGFDFIACSTDFKLLHIGMRRLINE